MTDELDDARVLASLGRILSAGDPYTGLPLLDPATKLFPTPVVDALLEPINEQKGASEGIAELDGDSLVPVAQIPVQAIADDPILSSTIVSGVEVGVDTYNLASYGAVPGTSSSNATANDAAWAAMMAAIPTVSDSFGGVAPTILIPAGIWMFSDSLVIPSTKRCRIIGAGSYASILRRAAGATGDLLTIQARATQLAHLGLDGNRTTDMDGGDLLVIDAPFCVQSDFFLANACEDALSVGKTSTAINNRAENGTIRYSGRYGVIVNAGHDTTDTEFDRVNVGTSGLSGFRLNAASVSLELCHSWGNGIENGGGTDYDGFYVASTGIRLHNCEGETNLGAGVSVRSAAHRAQIVGGRYWGNVRQGVSVTGADWGQIVGVTVSQNGVTNSAGSSGASFAGINLDAAKYWAVVGNVAQDFATAIAAGSYASAPTNPFPGKSAILTQSRAYIESGATDYVSIVGNAFRQEDTRNGVWGTVLGANNEYAGNIFGTGAGHNMPGETFGNSDTSNPTVKINGAVATVRRIELQTAGSARWYVQASAGAESGSNAGSEFEIIARTDAGAALTTPVAIQRSTGRVALTYPIKVHSAATGSRPTAAAAGAGGHMFDTTLGKPIWSDGTNWKDATGTNV